MSKSKKIEVKAVEIDIAGEKLRLSPDQARELRDILLETFPKDAPVPYIPYIPPIIIERERRLRPYDGPHPWYPSYPWITWGSDYTTSGTLLLTSGGTTTYGDTV